MTYFLCTAVGVPAIGFGLLFQIGEEIILGLLAVGMALVGWVAKHEWHLYRRVGTVAHRPLGYVRIDENIHEWERDAA